MQNAWRRRPGWECFALQRTKPHQARHPRFSLRQYSAAMRATFIGCDKVHHKSGPSDLFEAALDKSANLQIQLRPWQGRLRALPPSSRPAAPVGHAAAPGVGYCAQWPQWPKQQTHPLPKSLVKLFWQGIQLETQTFNGKAHDPKRLEIPASAAAKILAAPGSARQRLPRASAARSRDLRRFQDWETQHNPKGSPNFHNTHTYIYMLSPPQRSTIFCVLRKMRCIIARNRCAYAGVDIQVQRC